MRKPALFFDVGVRIDLEEAQRVLSPEQIEAVMVGIGKVLSVKESQRTPLPSEATVEGEVQGG